jgi:NAD(P)-dependent dehydrogenase (short-subunit alcohol dehydrogenase family)
MSQNFEGRTVLITGGGGGIGKAAAGRFLAEGANVVLSGTRRSVLEAAQRELDAAGERVAIRPGEITGRAQAQDLVRFAIERFGAVDVLVNSTGIFRPVPFLEQTAAPAARSSTSARCGPSTRSRPRRRAPTPPRRPVATCSRRTSRSSWQARASA